MNSAYFRFILDVQAARSQVSIPVSLNDTAITLYMSLTDGGKPYHIEDECLAKLSITRPSGSKIHEFCIIEGNAAVVYPFMQNPCTASEEGIHECELTLYGLNGEQITTSRFSIIVNERVVNVDDNNGITDEAIGIIDDMIHSEQQRRQGEAARLEAEKTRVSSESERTIAEAGRISAEAERRAFWGNKAAVYVGSGDMPEGYNVQVDPTGDSFDIADLISMENGQAEGSIQQIVYPNDDTANPKAIGEGAAAFGGKRWDKLDDPTRPTSEAAGKQSFVANAGNLADGDWSATFGKENKAYGGASFASGGGCVAGVSYEVFLELFGLVDGEETKELYEAARERSANYIDVATPEEAGYKHWFATARGDTARAYARSSDASGSNTETWADCSHVGGIQSKISKGGRGSRVDGGYNENYAPYANIDGANNINRADYGDISGCRNATNEKCIAIHIEGGDNKGLDGADYAHIEGNDNISIAVCSHAENYKNEIYAPCASVGGACNIVEETAGNSFTRGYRNRTVGENQFVSGVWCKPGYNRAEIVGNGKDEDNRSNAYELDWDGNGYYAGDVYANSSKKLVTVEYMTSVIKSLAEAVGLTDFEIPEES